MTSETNKATSKRKILFRFYLERLQRLIRKALTYYICIITSNTWLDTEKYVNLILIFLVLSKFSLNYLKISCNKCELWFFLTKCTFQWEFPMLVFTIYFWADNDVSILFLVSTSTIYWDPYSLYFKYVSYV